MTGSDYQNFHVWQKSMDLVFATYNITKQLPRSEERGLTSQMQRATVSIPSNVAEGYRRKSTIEFKRFLHIASGSLAELETQLIISARLYKLEVSTILNDLIVV